MQENPDILLERIDQFIRDISSVRAINEFSEIAIGTTLGSVREVNQDRALVINASYYNSPNDNFLIGVVCDGMGGLTNGDEAAIVAISAFASKVLRTVHVPIAERLSRAVLAANDAVFRKFRGRSGTTLSAVLVGSSERPIAVTVGDTRVYGITPSRELKQLSRDDTFAGILGEDKADPSRKNQLVQYVGMGEGIDPNIVYTYKNDFSSLLIATDGIHGAPATTLSQIVQNSRSVSETIRRLVALNEILGGHDNGTALLLPSKRISDSSVSPAHRFCFWSAKDQFEIWMPAYGARLADGISTEEKIEEKDRLPKIKEREQVANRKKRKTLKSRVNPKKKKRSEDEDAWLPIYKKFDQGMSLKFMM